jgi:hypothetical protein
LTMPVEKLASFSMHFGQPLEGIGKIGSWPASNATFALGLLCLSDGHLNETFRIFLDKFTIGGFVFMVTADFEDPVQETLLEVAKLVLKQFRL